MAAVMPGTVIRFGAEYRRRPVLSLFGGTKNFKDETLSVQDTHIKVQASIAITRGFPDPENLLVLKDTNEETSDPNDPRGQFVDIIT